jgi:hypothetical protein
MYTPDHEAMIINGIARARVYQARHQFQSGRHNPPVRAHSVVRWFSLFNGHESDQTGHDMFFWNPF